MMTDINIWSAGLSQQQVNHWMTCQDDPGLEENKIVDWRTANWTLEGVAVKSIPKHDVCWEAEGEKIYPFPSFQKNFFDSVDFCNILKGTVPVPQTESIMSEINAACGGSTFTGSKIFIFLSLIYSYRMYVLIYIIFKITLIANYLQI